MKQRLIEKLNQWVEHVRSATPVRQHDQEWIALKKRRAGGSSAATWLGLNPYESEIKFINSKVGLDPWKPSVAPQWGNLFERVICRYVCIDRDCEVVGSDIFLHAITPPMEGVCTPSPHISYSPDGFAVMHGDCVIADGEAVSYDTVLVEFKCPYRRMPRYEPPAYYVPQVKMGLAVCEIATRGLLIEGVFRRCPWDMILTTYYIAPDCGTPREWLGGVPLARGFIGLYLAENAEWPSREAFLGEYDIGPNNDIGQCSNKLFTALMSDIDNKHIETWYSEVRTDCDPRELNADLELFERHIGGKTLIGIMPWKLFKVNYHWIEKEDGYMDALLPRIERAIETIRLCDGLSDDAKRMLIDARHH